MPKFVVQKGHDALVYYERLVEAETIEQANELADKDKYAEGWFATGDHVEYDSCDILDENTVVLEEGEEFEQGDFTTLKLGPAERNTIIAALRLWQRKGIIPDDLIEIVRCGGVQPLWDNEIDVLIEEKLNV